MGTASPMPMKTSCLVGLMSAATMPSTRPSRSTSGPPELPGLTAASIWMRPWRTWSVLGSWKLRSSPDIDAGGDRSVQAQRVADGERLAADVRRPRVAQRGRHEVGGQRVGVQYGGVLVRSLDGDGGVRFGAVGEGQLDGRGVRDDVQAGERVTLVVDDDAAAEAVGGAAGVACQLGLDQHQRGSHGCVRLLRECRRRYLRGQRGGDAVAHVGGGQRGWAREEGAVRDDRQQGRGHAGTEQAGPAEWCLQAARPARTSRRLSALHVLDQMRHR